MTTVTQPAGDPPQDEDLPPGRGSLRLPLSPVSGDVARAGSIGAVVVGAVILLAGVSVGRAAGLAMVVLLVFGFAALWPALGGSHTPGATSLVLIGSGAFIIWAGRRDDLRWVAAAVALGIVLAFLQQLLRRTGREGLVASLLAAFGGLSVLASASLLGALGQRDETQGLLVITMVAVLASVLGDLLLHVDLLRPFLGLVVLVAAVGVALLVHSYTDSVSVAQAIGVASAAGSLSWSLRRVLALQPAMIGVRGQVAAGLGSVLAVGAIPYLFDVIS